MLGFTMEWLPIAAGFGIGLIVGITGVGGGSLMTPLLISVFNLEKAVAIGTDLWFAGLTKVSGSIATTAWMHMVGITKQADSMLSYALGIALVLTAVTIIFRPVWHRVGLWLEQFITPPRQTGLTLLCGLILGVLVSLSSIGAGALGATMILLLYPRLPTARLVGTDIAHAVPLTLVAGIGHATLGNVHWMLLIELLIGSVPAIWLGARLTKMLPDVWTRLALCASLLMAAKKILMTA